MKIQYQKIENGLEILRIWQDSGIIKVPEKFITDLASKAEQMSMNPMEYVDKKVYSYAHLYQSDIGTAYQASAFSGMLFNSYC